MTNDLTILGTSALERVPAIPVSLWDRDDPNSIFNRTDVKIGKAFEAIYKKHRKYFDLDEDRLYKLLKREDCKPTPTDNRLRYSFWQEFDRCIAKGHKKMKMSHVFGGICTHDYFYKRYILEPMQLVWFLCPPASYTVYVEEALNFGMSQLRTMLGYDDFNSKGEPDHKMMEIKAKIVKMLDERKHGLANQHSTSLNLNVTDKQLEKKVTEETMKAIEAKIQAIEDRAELKKPVINIEK